MEMKTDTNFIKVIKCIFKLIILFIIGGTIYVSLELLFRGRSHISMFILGGFCFVLIGGINNYISWEMPLILQMIIGAVVITTLEFITGYIVNIKLGLNVWDYSNQPLNIKGQICLLFSFLWMLISLIAIVLDDYLRYWIFKEKKPKYHLF